MYDHIIEEEFLSIGGYQVWKWAVQSDFYSFSQGAFMHLATDTNQEALLCERFVNLSDSLKFICE
jgi:hypothetical protein